MTKADTLRFPVAFRGYERTQVDIYLDRVEKGRRPSEPLGRPPDFTIVLRGYDREQVNGYLAGLAAASPSWTVQGEDGGDIPTLLRKVAESVEEREPVDVVDMTFQTGVGPFGRAHSMTVYFEPPDDDAP